MLDIYNFYERMEEDNVMLSFKGEVTSELLTSILSIVETRLEELNEVPKVRRKVFNVLVECLQNLYHHIDNHDGDDLIEKSAIFMITSTDKCYNIYTGNYIMTEHVSTLQDRIDKVNSLDRQELKSYYQEVLNNGQMSRKGGGGLGMIDIAKKSGQKLEYSFMSISDGMSFFTLKVKIEQVSKVK